MARCGGKPTPPWPATASPASRRMRKPPVRRCLEKPRRRQQDLDDLIRGARLTGTGDDAPLEWPDVADRKLIMQRLEWGSATNDLALPSRSAAEFQRQRDTLLHEGELAAALAQVLIQSDMPDADDREYDVLLRSTASERPAICDGVCSKTTPRRLVAPTER